MIKKPNRKPTKPIPNPIETQISKGFLCGYVGLQLSLNYLAASPCLEALIPAKAGIQISDSFYFISQSASSAIPMDIGSGFKI